MSGVLKKKGVEESEFVNRIKNNTIPLKTACYILLLFPIIRGLSIP